MNIPELNMDLVRGVLMIVLIIAFLGMWAWAWSGKRKRVFHDASMLPLEEDDGRIPQGHWQDGDDTTAVIEKRGSRSNPC
jgi:cytochrome c oxidase cbb3-type subunit 4